jgi:hypothetical protein
MVIDEDEQGKTHAGTAGAVLVCSSMGSSLSRKVFSVATMRRVAILNWIVWLGAQLLVVMSDMYGLVLGWVEDIVYWIALVYES